MPPPVFMADLDQLIPLARRVAGTISRRIGGECSIVGSVHREEARPFDIDLLAESEDPEAVRSAIVRAGILKVSLASPPGPDSLGSFSATHDFGPGLGIVRFSVFVQRPSAFPFTEQLLRKTKETLSGYRAAAEARNLRLRLDGLFESDGTTLRTRDFATALHVLGS
jgi:hypothetical protein